MGTYSLLHVADHFLHFLDGFPCQLIVLGRGHGSKLNLLVLELELGALDGQLHLLDGLITHALVHLLALSASAIVISDGHGSKLQSQGELEVSLGDDLRFLGIELQLVL